MEHEPARVPPPPPHPPNPTLSLSLTLTLTLTTRASPYPTQTANLTLTSRSSLSCLIIFRRRITSAESEFFFAAPSSTERQRFAKLSEQRVSGALYKAGEQLTNICIFEPFVSASWR